MNKTIKKIILIIFVFLLIPLTPVLAANTHSTSLARASSQSWSRANGDAVLYFDHDLTIEAWVKADSDGTKKSISFITSADGSADSDNFVWDTDTYAQADLGSDWSHVAVVWDKSDTSSTLYIDGVGVAGLGGSNNTIASSTQAMKIGGRNEFWNGQIDEVRVWDDIRTDVEISANYQSELTGTEANLLVYYKFNNDAGVDATSGVGCDGACDLTNNNSATFVTDVPFAGDGGSDSCTPTAGSSWQVALSDECHPTSNVLHNSSMECYGSGNYVVGSGVTVRVTSVNCPGITIKGGGKFIIMPSPGN